jgi:hypothetical protein
MGRSREKIIGTNIPEYKVSREYIFRYIHNSNIATYKLGSAMRHKGKMYEAFIVIKEREDK